MKETVYMYCDNNIIQLDDLAERLKFDMDAEFISQELALNNKVLLMNFEKFYMRTSSYTSLSILITEENGRQKAALLGSGGGDSVLNVSWGADKSIVKLAQKALTKQGFNTEDVA